ncbi:unnamed protein product, partial [Amoebophrya sp. A120]
FNPGIRRAYREQSIFPGRSYHAASLQVGKCLIAEAVVNFVQLLTLDVELAYLPTVRQTRLHFSQHAQWLWNTFLITFDRVVFNTVLTPRRLVDDRGILAKSREPPRLQAGTQIKEEKRTGFETRVLAG